MKKVLLVAAFAGLAMASCKKDYTCTCKDNDTVSPDPDIVVKYTKVKEKDAKASCDLAQTVYAGFYTCTLK